MGLGPTEWPQGCSLGMEPEVPGRGGGCITGTVGPGGGGGGQGGFLGSRPQDGAGSYRVAPRVLLGNGT